LWQKKLEEIERNLKSRFLACDKILDKKNEEYEKLNDIELDYMSDEDDAEAALKTALKTALKDDKEVLESIKELKDKTKKAFNEYELLLRRRMDKIGKQVKNENSEPPQQPSEGNGRTNSSLVDEIKSFISENIKPISENIKPINILLHKLTKKEEYIPKSFKTIWTWKKRRLYIFVIGIVLFVIGIVLFVIDIVLFVIDIVLLLLREGGVL
jgi:hypothetical protein